MMIETSAILAILLNETERAAFVGKIEKATAPMTTAVAVAEAAMAFASRTDISPSRALAIIEAFLVEADIDIVAFTPAMVAHATDARERFGRGRHPAALNFGDCLSYGAARHHGVTLLYKGDDFAQTDVNDEHG